MSSNYSQKNIIMKTNLNGSSGSKLTHNNNNKPTENEKNVKTNLNIRAR